MTHTLVDELGEMSAGLRALPGPAKAAIETTGYSADAIAFLANKVRDELERLHTLAQAAGFTGDDPVGEALKVIPVMRAELEKVEETADALGLKSMAATVRQALATPSPLIIDEED